MSTTVLTVNRHPSNTEDNGNLSSNFVKVAIHGVQIHCPHITSHEGALYYPVGSVPVQQVPGTSTTSTNMILYSRFALTNTFGTFRYFVFVTEKVFVISFPTNY